MDQNSKFDMERADETGADQVGGSDDRPAEAAGKSFASPTARTGAGGSTLGRDPDQDLTAPSAEEAGTPPHPSAVRAEGGPDQTSPVPSSAPPRKKSRKRLVLLVVLLAALVGGGYEGWNWWTVGRFEEATDDAYLHADMSVVSAKVGGYLASVEVADNAQVRTGEVIATIDDADYRLAVQSARDAIDVQQATIRRIEQQISAARSQVDEAEANLEGSQAALAFADNELTRKTELESRSFASRQELESARVDRDRARAELHAATAHLTSAQANVAVLEAERLEALKTLDSLRTQLDLAKQDLSYTKIRAPVDGVIGNRAADIGELVQPGSRIAAVVPLEDVYVDANFKETQLARMTPGQPVSVTVDAYPDEVFQGSVASLAPASGALFSLLPPENATGNFTKIVQRLPVRVVLDKAALEANILRPGMSAVVTVDTRTDEDRQIAERTETRIRTEVAGLVDRLRVLARLERADAAEPSDDAGPASVEPR